MNIKKSTIIQSIIIEFNKNTDNFSEFATLIFSVLKNIKSSNKNIDEEVKFHLVEIIEEFSKLLVDRKIIEPRLIGENFYILRDTKDNNLSKNMIKEKLQKFYAFFANLYNLEMHREFSKVEYNAIYNNIENYPLVLKILERIDNAHMDSSKKKNILFTLSVFEIPALALNYLEDNIVELNELGFFDKNPQKAMIEIVEYFDDYVPKYLHDVSKDGYRICCETEKELVSYEELTNNMNYLVNKSLKTKKSIGSILRKLPKRVYDRRLEVHKIKALK